MINAVEQSYQAQRISGAAQASGAPARTNAASSTDAVSLSDSGRLMSGFFADLGLDYTPGKAVTLEDMEDALQDRQRDFASEVTRLFLEQGIPLDPPARLTADETGRVRVQGDHPYKKQIEGLFESDRKLSNEFRKISALSSLVAAGREFLEFSRRYQEDPYAAVAEYAHLFNKLETDAFTMTIGGASADEAAA